MSMPSDSGGYLEWEALVGKAILRFGDIEVVSMRCLEFIPQDKIVDSSVTLEFGRRANILIELLEARPKRDANLNKILEGMKRARALAKIRNLIAHNPVMLDVYVNDDESTIVGEHAITSARSGKVSLTLEELKEFAAEVESLSAGLWLAFSNYAKTTEHMFSTRRGSSKS